MNPTISTVIDRLSGLYRALVARYVVSATSQKALVIAIVAAALIALVLIGAIASLPSQRKVIRKRRVRRIRRKVTRQPMPSKPAPTTSAAAAPAATEVAAPRTARPRRSGQNLALWVAAWIVLMVLSLTAVYVVTGSNRYCGESCHAADTKVAIAVKDPHADCIDCHESDPVSGSVARVRMALARSAPEASRTVVPVDPDRCLRCHADIPRATVKTESGLIVSHKEILAGGRACSDCHAGVGHQKGTVIVGGMSRCMACHDGVVASRACETCHVGGSPITMAGDAKKATSAFDYAPTVRVANRNCARCHGAEKKCRECHNGLVLPHPAAFVEGGHASMSAFDGKEKCFKCHTIAWCGSGKCHNGFSAHDEATWPLRHQAGTSTQCGSCHIAWDGKGDWCDVCH